MNIVKSGNSISIYGEEVQTYKTLPVGTYRVCFSPLSGFSLQPHDDLITDEKIYGNTCEKVTKVLRTFGAFNRNMGVILSGPKGAGKSMFARCLATEGKKQNLPLIIVDGSYAGLSDFISKIKQECIVLFDEFEKTFDRENGEQESLLSLFDGLDAGKKLFVLTCNDTYKLSEFLLNRPGRFHYHFEFGVLSEEEMEEYLEDTLVDTAKKYIPEIILASGLSEFTYDILRAVVFELNNGYTLEETLEDLNIERSRFITGSINIEFENGITAHAEKGVRTIDLKDDDNIVYCVFDTNTLPEEFRTRNARGTRDTYVILHFGSSSFIRENGITLLNPESVELETENNISDDDVLYARMDELLSSLVTKRIVFNRVILPKHSKLV